MSEAEAPPFDEPAGRDLTYAQSLDEYKTLQSGDDEAQLRRDYAILAEDYYDLVTDFYEFGWGQSFHFAPLRKGKGFSRRCSSSWRGKPGLEEDGLLTTMSSTG